MNKWEYKRRSLHGVMTIDELSTFGNDGWELIQVIIHGTILVHIFKRPLC